MTPIDYIYIETTNYCNLKCSFCNRDQVIGSLQHMTLFNFQSLLEKIKDHPVKEAKLMGMGEPFLHPNFDEMKSKVPGIRMRKTKRSPMHNEVYFNNMQ